MVLQTKVISTSGAAKMEREVNKYCIKHVKYIKELHFPTDRTCVVVFDVPARVLSAGFDTS